MARRSWIDKAAETGDWSAAKKKAKGQIRKSNIRILFSPRPGRPLDDDEERREIVERTRPAKFEETVAEPEPEEQPDEYEIVGELPEEEETEPGIPTVAEAYEAYRARGGNRLLPERILEELGETLIDEIDRKVIVDVGRKLYPGLAQSERAELIHDPIEEVVGYMPKASPPTRAKRNKKKPGRYDPYAYWLGAKAESEARTERIWAEAWALNSSHVGPLSPSDTDAWRFKFDEHGNVRGRGPRDEAPNRYLPGSRRQWWDYQHRGFLSKHHGTKARLGPPPKSGKGKAVFDKAGTYIGHEPGKVGRPRSPNKLSNAEKQKRYREKMKSKRKSK
jgi:hypothetical protein